MISLIVYTLLVCFVGAAIGWLIQDLRVTSARDREQCCEQRKAETARTELEREVLDTPVSQWIRQAEAEAERDFAKLHPKPTPKADKVWVTLYHAEQDAYHDVSNNPIVIADFATRGWVVAEGRDPMLPDPSRPPEWR